MTTTVDVAHVQALMDIAERANGHSGKLGNLQSWAINQLIEINGQLKADAVEQSKRATKESAKRQAEVKESVEPVEPEPAAAGDEVIYTSDTPNPTLIERRV